MSISTIVCMVPVAAVRSQPERKRLTRFLKIVIINGSVAQIFPINIGKY